MTMSLRPAVPSLRWASRSTAIAAVALAGTLACACGGPARVKGDEFPDGTGGGVGARGGQGGGAGSALPGSAGTGNGGMGNGPAGGSAGSGGTSGAGGALAGSSDGARPPAAGSGGAPAADAGQPSDGTSTTTTAPDGAIAYPAPKGDIYVSPTGDDANDGRSAAKALKTIQKALSLAMPGDAINLAPGTYVGDQVTVRDGQPNAPIIIKGPPTAIVKGARKGHMWDVFHSHIVFDGFTMDGLRGDPKTEDGWTDSLVYVLGKSARSGPTGVRLLRMTLKNAGGECVRFRYFCTKNEVAHSTITTCGAHDYLLNRGGKNGEGVYIGTAPEQLADGKSPTKDPDLSNDNWIHDNVIETRGNECVDVKESATRNIIERNKCTGQKDPESAGFDSRGSGNVFRGNESYGNVGAGVRLGGDGPMDGINNDIYDNILRDNMAGAISIQRMPQGKICGNKLSNNGPKDVRGTGVAAIKPADPCP